MMEKKYARLAVLLTVAVLCGNGAPSMAAWWEGNGTETIKITEDNASEITSDVYGNQDHPDTTNTVTGHVEMTGGTVGDDVYGGWADDTADVKDSTVTINDGKVGGDVYGGYSNGGAATGNTVTITDSGKVGGDVYGGYSKWGAATGNTVALSGSADVTASDLYGRNDESKGSGNALVLDDWSGTVKSLHNFDAIDFENIDLSQGAKLDVTDEITDSSGVKNAAISINSLKAGDYAAGETKATVTWDTDLTGAVTIADDVTKASRLFGDRDGGGIYMNDVIDTSVTHKTGTNTVRIMTTIDKSVLTGQFIDENGAIHQNSAYEGDTPQTLVIGDGFVTNAGTVAGAYAAGGQTAEGGSVRIESTGWNGTVYGGYSETGAAAGNTVYVGDYDETGVFHKADASNVTVVGGKGSEISGNTLAVTGNGNTLKGISGMSSIDFQQVMMAKETEDSTAALTLSDTNGVDLGGTSLHVSSLAGGNTYAAGDHVTLLSAEHGITSDNGPVDVEKITAGVTQDLSVETTYGEDNKSIGLEVRSVSLNPQTDLIAENRAVAAAFVNQGADIAADSLRLLDDGYHYGTQTFGAVYGNRSTYDVASDIKINGWSEIAGFGNIHEVKGGRLAWGVFYENGTGNYRTWNTFNNEMFRGDGSLLYNGGGAAIRLTKDSGMYYEASLRAGTLSSSMINAVKDGNGNSYGFDSDSTYWGAHVGAGKLIQRGSGQWDIYGKYFHTDIDGDSFEMGGDRFSFDSVTSDRLRLGARYIADTDKAWSLYCGAAYEYEFSGDSHMKAGQFDAPEQSLQGSTVFGEIGTVWGRKDSPWSMDVNLRGYAGEREGFSGMVQLAYAF